MTELHELTPGRLGDQVVDAGQHGGNVVRKVVQRARRHVVGDGDQCNAVVGTGLDGINLLQRAPVGGQTGFAAGSGDVGGKAHRANHDGLPPQRKAGEGLTAMHVVQSGPSNIGGRHQVGEGDAALVGNRGDGGLDPVDHGLEADAPIQAEILGAKAVGGGKPRREARRRFAGTQIDPDAERCHRATCGGAGASASGW